MELPNGVEWALHCAWLLALLPDGTALTTRRLAEFYGLPEAYLAKLLKALVRAGLLVATTGPRGGFRLARPAAAITVLDLVEAIEGRSPLFRCQEIRQCGPAALSPQACRHACGIAQIMHRAESAWRGELAATTVADLVASANGRSTHRATRWLATLTAGVGGSHRRRVGGDPPGGVPAVGSSSGRR